MKSAKKNCGWKAKAVFRKKLNAWQFEVIDSDHNHTLDAQRGSYLVGHRRRDRTPDVVARILQYAKQPKMTASDIVAVVRGEFPDIKIDGLAVSNVIRIQKMAEAGSLTPT